MWSKTSRKKIILGAHSFDGAKLRFVFDLPDGIVDIAEYAFANSGISGIGIPKGITKIQDNVFNNADNLVMVEFPDTLKEIGSSAFYDCNDLAFADLPDGLETIGYYAFENTAISEVILPDTVTSVQGNSFGNAPVTYLKWTAGIQIFPNGEFCNNGTYPYSLLKTVVLPEGVTEIASYYGSVDNGAFANTPLESITLPSSLTTIGDGAFYGCSNLTDVYYDGLKTVKEFVLQISNENTSLTEAEWHYTLSEDDFALPSQLTAIEAQAFEGLPIVALVIPSSVQNIGDQAFASCTDLRALVILNGDTQMGADITDNSGKAIIYCPKNSTVAAWCDENNAHCVKY